MQTSPSTSVLVRGKRFFIVLGLISLVVGFSLIVVYSVVIKPDRVLTGSVNLTGDQQSYSFNAFHSEKGDLVQFQLTTSNKSFLQLINYSSGLAVWSVEHTDAQTEMNGALYNESVQINSTGDYQVELLSFASHAVYPPSGYVIVVYDNNTFSGNFYLLRMPSYYSQLLLTGEAFLAVSCGFLLVPTILYFLARGRRLGMNA